MFAMKAHTLPISLAYGLVTRGWEWRDGFGGALELVSRRGSRFRVKKLHGAFIATPVIDFKLLSANDAS